MFRSSKDLNFYTGILGGILDNESDSDDDFEPSVNFPENLDLDRIRIDYDVTFEGNTIHASRQLYLRYLSKKKQFLFFENIRNVTENKEAILAQNRKSGYHTLMNLIDLSKTRNGTFQCNDQDLRIEFSCVYFQQLAEEGIIGFVEKEKYGVVMSGFSFYHYLKVLQILKRGVSRRNMKDLTRTFTKPFFFKNRVCFWDTTSILEMSKLIYFDKFCTDKNNLFEISKNNILHSRIEGIDLCMDLIVLPNEDKEVKDPEELANRRKEMYMKFGLHRCDDERKVQIFREEVELRLGMSKCLFDGLEKIVLRKLSMKIDPLEVSALFCGIDTTCREFRRYLDKKIMMQEISNLILYGSRENPRQSRNIDKTLFRNRIFLSIDKNDPQTIRRRIRGLRILKNMKDVGDDEYDDFSMSLIIGKNLRIRWTEMSIVSISEVKCSSDEESCQFLIPLNSEDVLQTQKFEDMIVRIADTIIYWNSQHYFKRRFLSQRSNGDEGKKTKLRLDLNKDEEGTQFLFFKELLDCIFKESRKVKIIKELEDYFSVFYDQNNRFEETKTAIFNRLVIPKEKSGVIFQIFTSSINTKKREEGEEEEEGEGEKERVPEYVSFEIGNYESFEKCRYRLYSAIKESDFESKYAFYHLLIIGKRNAIFVNTNKFGKGGSKREEKYESEFNDYFQNFLGKGKGMKTGKGGMGRNDKRKEEVVEVVIDKKSKSVIVKCFKKRRVCDLSRDSIRFLDMNMTERKIEDNKYKKYYQNLQNTYLFPKKSNKSNNNKKKEEEEEDVIDSDNKRKEGIVQQQQQQNKNSFPVETLLVVIMYIGEPEDLYKLLLVSKRVRVMIEKDVLQCCRNVTFRLKISHEKQIGIHLTSPTQQEQTNKRIKRRTWKFVHRLHIGNSSKYGGVTFNREKDLQIYLLSDLFPNLKHLRISENNVLRNSNLNHLQMLESLELFWCKGIDNPKSFRCLSKTLRSFTFSEHSLLKINAENDDDDDVDVEAQQKANQLYGVNDSIFLYLDNLEVLKLGRYHDRFGPFGFKHIKNLKYLELSYSHLGDAVFVNNMNLGSLETLVLMNCENITTRCFSDKMKKLEKVVVENCESVREIGFLKLPAVKFINIKGCKVMSIIKMERVIERLEKKSGRKISFSMKY